MELDASALNTADLTEQTYRMLRDEIIERRIEPGEKISVDTIARQLGISRTPVMDALKRLAADRLVEIVPRRGTFVTELTARDMAELFEIRAMIELYVARRILEEGLVSRLLDAVREPMQGMEQALKSDTQLDSELFIVNDHLLHLGLVSQLDNSRLTEMYKDLNVHIQIARAHYFHDVQNVWLAHEEHSKIIESLEAGKDDQALAALGAHITRVRDRVLELLEEHGGRL